MTPTPALIAQIKKAFSIWEYQYGVCKIYVKETAFESVRFSTKAKAMNARHKLAFAVAKSISESK